MRLPLAGSSTPDVPAPLGLGTIPFIMLKLLAVETSIPLSSYIPHRIRLSDSDASALVNKCRMDTAAGKVNLSRNYGPQRNLLQGRGKERVGDDRRPYAPPNGHHNRSYQGSKPTVGGFQPDTFPLCSKFGRRHMGTICLGAGNSCFHCKEPGHMKKFCPKLNRGVNVVKAEKHRTTGRVFTMSGAETFDVDGLFQDRLELQTESLPFDLVVSTPTSVLVVVSTFVTQCPVVR
ncbi:hypothetical protein Lal_00032142 [Lupinus albus]|nr:hypothetical protein Lal_00032142 [Lupinus albus]